MQAAQKILHDISFVTSERVTPSQLKYMAYSGQYQRVYSIFKSLAKESRISFYDKYVLNQCIWAGIEKIKTFRSNQPDLIIIEEKLFLDDVLTQFIEYCELKDVYPRELFQSMLYWADELINLSYLEDSYSYLQKSFKLGIDKYADLKLSARLLLIRIQNEKGDLDEAYKILFDIASKPYFITDWNQFPTIIFNLSQLAIKKGDSEYYKALLFLGLRLFYTNSEVRESFVAQLRFTFRRSIDLMLSSEVQKLDKFFYLIHWLVGKIPSLKKIHLGFINRYSKYLLLAYIYFYNFIARSQPIILRESPIIKFSSSLLQLEKHVPQAEPSKVRGSDKILITRAMGGIGDLLMMTPGFHALKTKYPQKEIHLAIPKRYFPVFENNADVTLLDIENPSISHLSYGKWFNLSNCPAARVESRTAPKVKKSRIDIFSKALGINFIQLTKMDKTPRFIFSDNEIEFGKSFFNYNKLCGKIVIGVQLHSDESYRDYPFMEALVQMISKHYHVLIFDTEPIEGYNFQNVTKIQSLPLRKAFAIASQCCLIIAPDSSFVHFAAAINLPTIALFGPIDGKVRTKHYPNCTYINIKEKFGCSPCWRNENIPCKLTGMRASVCMENIQPRQIFNKLNEILLQRKYE